jgi:hypothetical protein
VAAGAVGYWRGWLSVTNEGKVEVQVDAGKFNQDKEAFSKSVGDKAETMKDQVAGLWEKSEGLTGDEKTRVQTELGELKKKRDQLDQKIKELEGVDLNKFESIRRDLLKALEEVEGKIEDLRNNLDKGMEK